MFLESFLSLSVMNASFVMSLCCSGSLVNMEQMATVALLNLTVMEAVYVIQLLNIFLYH